MLSESAKKHKKNWCELCLDLKWHDSPLDIHHHHYRTYGRENKKDVATLCRDCHIAIELENEKLGSPLSKYQAYYNVLKRLRSPKFVTIYELDIDPEQVIKILQEKGFVDCQITPTSLGIKSGIIKPTDGGFLVRKSQTINK